MAVVLELKSTFPEANKGNAALVVRSSGAVHKRGSSPGDQKHRTVVLATRYLVLRVGSRLSLGDGLFLLRHGLCCVFRLDTFSSRAREGQKQQDGGFLQSGNPLFKTVLAGWGSLKTCPVFCFICNKKQQKKN